MSIKGFISIFLLLIVSPHLIGQTNFVFSDSATWSFKSAGWDGLGGWYVSNNYEQLKYDTVFFDGYYWQEFEGTASNALLRSDSEKVYATQITHLEFDYDSVYTLYDFSLVVGDTAHNIIQVASIGSEYLILEAIYDTVINGIDLKVYQFNKDKWIENIGSIYGFLNPIYLTVPLGGSFELCSYQGGYTDDLSNLFWLNLTYPNVCVLSVEAQKVTDLSFSADKYYLTVSGVVSPRDYQIYSLLGSVSLSGTLVNPSSLIPISTLNPGVYFLKVGEQSFVFVK